MSIPEIISIVKDIVTVITLIIGATVTIYGVNTWRKQLKAKSEYDLAKRVLINVYKVRDAFMTVHTFLRFADAQTIDAKFTKLAEASSNLEIELLEAKAMWGDNSEFNKTFNLFKGSSSELVDYYYGFDPEIQGPIKYDDEVHSGFREEIDAGVIVIENLLRPKLKMEQAKKQKRK